VGGVSAEHLRRFGVRHTLTPKRPRREVENPEFGRFVGRILRAYARRVGDGDLTALGDLAKLREEITGI
jgi:hypothetical protein